MQTRIRLGIRTAAGLALLLGVAPRAGADYVVSGTVSSTSSNPLANVPIQVYDANGDLVTTVNSGVNGAYSVDLGASASGAYTIHEAEPATSYQQVTPTIGANSNATAASGLVSQNGTVATVVVPNTNASPTSPPDWNYNNQPNWVTGAPLLPFEAPVNLTGPTTDLSKVLTITNNDATVQPINVQNTGAQFKFNYNSPNGDTITAGGTTYSLSQFHFHMPSENTISGVNQSMELHFVYTNPTTGAESVVAVFANNAGAAAPANTAIAPIISNIQALATANGLGSPSTFSGALAAINLAAILPTNTQGYYFYGSLTTPPLSVGVNWFVFSTPISINDAQYQALKNFEVTANFYPNNRAVQPNDGRQLNEVDYNVILTSTTTSFTTANFELAPVPEPSSIVLLGLGAAGLAFRTLRRRPAA